MSLVVRVSDLPDSDAKPDADEIAVKSGKGAATMTFEGYSVVADSKGGISADDIVAQMKARGLLDRAMVRLGLSARAYDRIIKVARTIADLDGAADIAAAHISEAIN